MKKTTLMGLIVASLLVVGVIFVSAHFAAEDVSENSEPEVRQPVQPTCNAETCDWECGGNCGIPTCGYGR